MYIFIFSQFDVSASPVIAAKKAKPMIYENNEVYIVLLNDSYTSMHCVRLVTAEIITFCYIMPYYGSVEISSISSSIINVEEK